MVYLRVRFNDFYSEFVVNDILLFGKARESLTSSKITFSKTIVDHLVERYLSCFGILPMEFPRLG
jgi:hypothetical protein